MVKLCRFWVCNEDRHRHLFLSDCYKEFFDEVKLIERRFRMKEKLGEKTYYFSGNPFKGNGKVLFDDAECVDNLGGELKQIIGSSKFDLIWDNTDHFNFLCECGNIPDVIRVMYTIVQTYPTLYFILSCKCGKSGQRKIYCNDKIGNPGMMKAIESKKLSGEKT
jgi:hypothetical protein